MNLKRIILRLGMAVVCCEAHGKLPAIEGEGIHSDWIKTLSSYNVVWDSPSVHAGESMPVGGGDIGCNVWVEDGELLAYFQRSGSFNENGEYLKLGRLRLELSPNPFVKGASFRQELNLRDGCIEIEALGSGDASFPVKMKFWVEVDRPVIHLDITADQPVEATASYENWRFEDSELKGGSGKERWGCFSLEGYPGKVEKFKDEVSFDGNGVLFHHRNPEEGLVPGLLIRQQGLEDHAAEIYDNISNRTFGGRLWGDGFVPAGTHEGKYQITPFRAWSLKSSEASKTHSLTIGTHIAQTRTLDEWKDQLLTNTRGSEKDVAQREAETIGWWHQFWDRSWIAINPDQPDPKSKSWQAGRNYNLFRYQLGCNVSGDYPTKFNGGNFTYDPVLVTKSHPYDPDWRAWGGDVFTSQNQRLLYWPMLKSGDFDAMPSQFKLYQRGLAGAKLKARIHFGHGGAKFCEYMNAPGLDLGAGWGWEGPSHRRRGKEVPLGDPSVDGLGGYDRPVEKGVMANSSISYHWEAQVEHSYMMLEYHRFSGADLRPYLPVIEASLVFFDEHYQLREKLRSGKGLNEQGKLVFFPSTSCESYRAARDPADLISGIRACLESLLALDDSILPADRKAYYRGYLDRMPGYYFDQVDKDRIIKPAESWMKYHNVECPQFYPLFPFNRFDFDSPEMPVFRDTWKHGKFPKNMVISWHQDGIFFARMGMLKEAADYNVRKLQDSGRRFPTFWGPGHDWTPDHNWGGSGMIGLQEMLMQTVGSEIRLLPTWPEDWNATFRLHAPGQTTVTGRVEDGKLIELEVDPPERRKDVIIQKSARQ